MMTMKRPITIELKGFKLPMAITMLLIVVVAAPPLVIVVVSVAAVAVVVALVLMVIRLWRCSLLVMRLTHGT